MSLHVPDFLRAEVEAILRGEYAVPLPRAPRTVLDIGANLGAFSLWARHCWPDARILAFEPEPRNARQFRRNLKSEGSHVQFTAAAVRRFDGVAELYLGDGPTTHSFHRLGRQRAQTVRVRCVDAASLPSCEFVKIDTEGCELEIVERLDLSATQAVALEYHRGQDAAKIQALLTVHGFRVQAHQPHGPGLGLLKFIRDGQQKLFVALPVYRELDALAAQCLLRLIQNPPCELQIRLQIGDSLVCRARNSLTADFLAGDASHLLFIDGDLLYGPDHIARLMCHSADVVGGLYPKKQEGPLQWVCNGCLAPTDVGPDGLQEVRYVGTGFLRVARRVFERMIAADGDRLAYTPDHDPQRTEWDFWSVGVHRFADGSKRYLSEDWSFCQRWLDLGGKVYADTRVILKHVGSAVYPLKSQLPELMSAANSNGPLPGHHSASTGLQPAAGRACQLVKSPGLPDSNRS